MFVKLLLCRPTAQEVDQRIEAFLLGRGIEAVIEQRPCGVILARGGAVGERCTGCPRPAGFRPCPASR
eukprot:5509099-Pyramimonas_sp.AAC.1